MAPKRASRSAAAAAAPPAKKAKVEPPAKPAAKAAPAKAPKAAKPAAKAAKPATKSTKKGKTSAADPKEFVNGLVDICKVLMSVCESTMLEDEEKLIVTTTEDFNTYGAGILKLLPEEARMPMMKMSLMYQEELDHDPFLFTGEDDYEDEDGPAAIEGEGDEEEADDDDDDDDDVEMEHVMRPEHFYHFKTYFTEAEAAALIEGVKEGGSFSLAFEAAVAQMLADDDDDDDDGEEEEEEEDEDEDEDDDDLEWDEDVPWKEA